MMAQVLITGATGFIGFRTLVVLLNAQYNVRVAIRRPDQETQIRNAASIKEHLSQLSFILVPDNTIVGAYQAAVQSVDHVIHVASPVPSKLDIQARKTSDTSWADMFYDPAIKGTLEMLRAVADTPSVKRVVITSSGNVLASVVGEKGDSSSTIRCCPSMVEAEAVENAGQAYKMSKILAITAARDFVRAQQDQGVTHFSVVYICSGYVQGAHELCDSVEDSFLTTSGGTLNLAVGKSLPIPVKSQIWVEDVAKAHVMSLTSSRIDDGDVLVLVGNDGQGWEWAEVADTLRQKFSTEIEKGVLKPALDQKSMPLHFDSRETQSKLGWPFAGPEVWAVEVVGQYLMLERKLS